MYLCVLTMFLVKLCLIQITLSSWSSENVVLFTLAALWSSFFASSFLPRVMSQRADSGRNLLERRFKIFHSQRFWQIAIQRLINVLWSDGLLTSIRIPGQGQEDWRAPAAGSSRFVLNMQFQTTPSIQKKRIELWPLCKEHTLRDQSTPFLYDRYRLYKDIHLLLCTVHCCLSI